MPRRRRRSVRVIGQFTTGSNTNLPQDEFKELDLQDVARKEERDIDRLYNQLESTGSHRS